MTCSLIHRVLHSTAGTVRHAILVTPGLTLAPNYIAPTYIPIGHFFLKEISDWSKMPDRLVTSSRVVTSLFGKFEIFTLAVDDVSLFIFFKATTTTKRMSLGPLEEKSRFFYPSCVSTYNQQVTCTMGQAKNESSILNARDQLQRKNRIAKRT